MSDVMINNTYLGGELMNLLSSENIQPGSQAGYELCKLIWEYHPLGGKLVEKPVRLALSKPRVLTIDCQPKEMLIDAFQKEWDRLGATNHIRDVMFINRTYGAAGIVVGADQIPTTTPIDPWLLPDLNLYFNQLDPLNMAGSIVTNQNPNAPDFQKPLAYTTAAGQPYHPSRAVVVFNGTPIYLSYQSSGFGYTGRSVFQRALYPLKSFVQSMITDDLVTFKSGLIIAKQKPAGSIVNRLMQTAAGIKRTYLQEGGTGNVLSIDIDEMIESIDLNNTATSMTTARDNIIANIAAASDVPALLLKDEAFTQGFGEGTEDAKAIVQYVEGIRTDMASLFRWFDKIVQHRAWNREFFEAVKKAYPEIYRKMTYEQAFYNWQKNFKADWESLMEEPESEKVKVAEIKLKGITEILRTVLPVSDGQNRGIAIQWAQDNINEMPDMFQSTLQLDIDGIAEFEPPAESMPSEKMPRADGGYWANPNPKADADFKETDHPRDKDGKFTSGGGGSSSSSELPPHLQALVKKINGGYKSGETKISEVNIPGYSPSEPDKPEHHDIEPYDKTTAKEETVTITKPNGKEVVQTKASVVNSLKPTKELSNGGYMDSNGFEHSPNLNPQERKIENNFYYQILTNEDKLIEQYHTDFGNKIDPDDVKRLDPEFRKDPGLAAAVHEPSSYLSKVIWQKSLSKKKEQNDTSPVMFTAGGSGSGKSEAMGLAKRELGLKEDSLTFDSVLGDFDKSTKKIQEALDGQKGNIDIVYTNAPLELATQLNLKRDRTVRLDVLVDAHIKASENIKKLAKHYEGNERINISVVNNTGDPPDLAVGRLSDVYTYRDREAIKKRLIKHAKQLVKEGKIPDGERKLKMLLA
jgi:hypothetical protein